MQNFSFARKSLRVVRVVRAEHYSDLKPIRGLLGIAVLSYAHTHPVHRLKSPEKILHLQETGRLRVIDKIFYLGAIIGCVGVTLGAGFGGFRCRLKLAKKLREININLVKLIKFNYLIQFNLI